LTFARYIFVFRAFVANKM